MRYAFHFVVSCLLLVICHSLTVENQFTTFRQSFQKSYVDESEVTYRMSVFESNLRIIEEHNTKQKSYILGVTPFTDLTNEEFRNSVVLNAAIQNNQKKLKLSANDGSKNDLQSLPKRVDWREMKAVSPVKDQKSCGSCWAFSACGAIEGALAQATGEIVSLSPQYLVDCDYADNGCKGGLMDQAFEFVMNNGVPMEDAYPYRANEGSCKKTEFKTSILGYYDVPAGNAYELKLATSKNPVAVAIDAGNSVFQNYKSGILNDAACGHALNHGVLLVGYESDVYTPYYIVKNSWGTKWGNEGYVHLAIVDGAYGTCGIQMMPSYPFIDL